MPFDAARARARFPIFEDAALVFLDSAASAQKPQAVLDALAHHYQRDNANIHRGVYDLSARATAAYEAARARVAAFLGAASPDEIVFTRGATEAINLVAQSFVRPRLGPGDEILVTEMEHHANIVPWQLIAEATGAVVVPAPVTDAGDLDLDAFAARVSSRTKFISVVHVSNAIGTVNPIADIIEIAKKNGIPTLIDAAQSVTHVPLDVQALGCDFLAFSGHKLYGPTGIGALYGRAELLAAMPPYQGGGDMIERVSFSGTTFAAPPARFEAGTPHIAGAVGLGAAIDWLTAQGLADVAAYEATLLDAALEALDALAGVHVVGRPRERASVISFLVDGLHPSDVGTLLDGYGIAVRTGHHCAWPLMDRLGVPGTTRLSVGVYNTLDDIERFSRALTRIVERFAR
ncbi:MAG: cysteine desulfurase [Myxococcales bacterium]|nr:cysteine desulfurase [Myxococcales bacterium]